MYLVKFLQLIKQMGLDAFMTPVTDEHFSEIIGPSDMRVKTLTGYSGTYGYAIAGKINIFITSVQFVERANKEVKGFTVYDDGVGIHEYIIQAGIKKIGVNTKTITSFQFLELRDKLKAAGIELVEYDYDLFDKVWYNRPKREFKNIFNLEKIKLSKYIDKNYISLFPELKIDNDINYDLERDVVGEKFESKIKRIRELMDDDEGIIITRLNTLGWLLNLRGSDLDYTPDFYGFGYLTKNEFLVWTGKKIKLRGIENFNYDQFYNYLPKIKEKKVLISGESNYYIFSKLKKPEKTDKLEKLESQKNSVELFGFKNAGIKDAVAIIKLFSWIKNHLPLSEAEIKKKLLELKSANSGYIVESFEPIVAANKNSRLIYHRADETILKENELLMVDTGSHYYHGTTDITRTVCFGEPSEDMKRFYTITLKALVRAKFIRKKNITGNELNKAARHFFQLIGKDYPTDTGHGVGYLSHVHDSLPKIGYREDIMSLYNAFTLEPFYIDS
ncbi:MAG: M24 family metallopeptidase, partial [Lactobacillaceae bacterium]